MTFNFETDCQNAWVYSVIFGLRGIENKKKEE